MSKTFYVEKFNYYVYYKQNLGGYRLLDRNDVFKTMERLPSEGTFKGYEMFQVLESKKDDPKKYKYEANDEGLLLFRKDMSTWIYQLRKNKTKSIMYDYYYSHHCAVEGIFKDLSENLYYCVGSEGTKACYHSHQSPTEYKYSEKCRNSGMIYVKKRYIPMFWI